MAKYPAWDAPSRELSGTSRVVAGEPYRIIVATNGTWPLYAGARDETKTKFELIDAANGLAVLTLESSENADVRWWVTREK